MDGIDSNGPHEVFMIFVGRDGRAQGNKGTGSFRFLPRIGEHVLIRDEESEATNIYKVVDIQHDPVLARMEIWLFNQGNHLEHVVPIPDENPS